MEENDRRGCNGSKEKAAHGSGKGRTGANAQGIDKPRLNRRKFAQEAVETFQAEINLSNMTDIFWVSEALAVMTAGWELRPITQEQIGVFKAMRMAVEMKRLRAKCKERGEALTIEALFDAVEAIKNQ